MSSEYICWRIAGSKAFAGVACDWPLPVPVGESHRSPAVVPELDEELEEEEDEDELDEDELDRLELEDELEDDELELED